MADADGAACCGSSSATNSVSCRNSMTCSMYEQVNFFVASQVGGKRRGVVIPNPSAKVVDVAAALSACPQHNWSSACGHVSQKEPGVRMGRGRGEADAR